MRHNIIPREFPTWQKLGFKSWEQWQECESMIETFKDSQYAEYINWYEFYKVLKGEI